MANTRFVLRRTSIAGRVANSTYISTGELGLNYADQILYSLDGSNNPFVIGANAVNYNCTNCVTINAAAVGTIPLQVKAAPSATANIFQVSNSAAVVFAVNSSGVLVGNGAGITSVTATAAPGGANTQIQFNDSGSTGGDANLTWNKTTAQVTVGNSTVNVATNTSAIIVGNAGGFSITGAAIVVGNSSVNTFINSSAVLINGSPVGGGSPGGANQQIQFNDSNAFAGEATFLWDKSVDKLSISTINASSVGTAYTNSSITIGNSSVNCVANSSTITVGKFVGNGNSLTTLNAASLPAGGSMVANATGLYVNAASGLVANATGLWVQAGDGMVVNATGVHNELPTKSFDILLPAAGDSYTIFWTKVALTLSEISLVISNTGASAFANLGFYYGTNRTTATTANGLVNLANNTTGIRVTAFAATAIPANGFFWCNVSATDTTPNVAEIHCTVRLA